MAEQADPAIYRGPPRFLWFALHWSEKSCRGVRSLPCPSIDWLPALEYPSCWTISAMFALRCVAVLPESALGCRGCRYHLPGTGCRLMAGLQGQSPTKPPRSLDRLRWPYAYRSAVIANRRPWVRVLGSFIGREHSDLHSWRRGASVRSECQLSKQQPWQRRTADGSWRLPTPHQTVCSPATLSLHPKLPLSSDRTEHPRITNPVHAVARAMITGTFEFSSSHSLLRSAMTINRMLATGRLPPRVRLKLLEYIAEKMSGAYGDRTHRLKAFASRISPVHMQAVPGTKPDAAHETSVHGVTRRFSRSPSRAA
jgi:hypothetical protein